MLVMCSFILVISLVIIEGGTSFSWQSKCDVRVTLLTVVIHSHKGPVHYVYLYLAVTSIFQLNRICRIIPETGRDYDRSTIVPIPRSNAQLHCSYVLQWICLHLNNFLLGSHNTHTSRYWCIHCFDGRPDHHASSSATLEVCALFRRWSLVDRCPNCRAVDEAQHSLSGNTLCGGS